MSAQRALEVEAFSLYGDDDTGHVHFEDDGNLFVHYSPNGTRMPNLAGLLVVELGIDGYRSHRVRAEVRNFRNVAPDEFAYSGDRVAALNDAIDALTAVRDQLEVMRTPNEARAAEHNAIRIGEDYGRSQATA